MGEVNHTTECVTDLARRIRLSVAVKLNVSLLDVVVVVALSILTVQFIEPPKRILIEEEICKRLDGCPIVKGVCETCYIVK